MKLNVESLPPIDDSRLPVICQAICYPRKWVQNNRWKAIFRPEHDEVEILPVQVAGQILVALALLIAGSAGIMTLDGLLNALR